MFSSLWFQSSWNIFVKLDHLRRYEHKQYLKPPPSFPFFSQLRVLPDLLLQLAHQHPVLSTPVIILAFQPAEGSFLTRWKGKGDRRGKAHILSRCSLEQTQTNTHTPPWKLTWQAGKITNFNRKYIFIHGGCFFLSCWFSGQTTFLFETWPLLLVGGFNPSENKHVHQQGNLLQMEVKLQNGGETSKWRWASGVTPPLLRKSLSRSKVRPAFWQNATTESSKALEDVSSLLQVPTFVATISDALLQSQL